MKIEEVKRIGASSMVRVITFLGEEIIADEVTAARHHIKEHANLSDEAFHAFCEEARFDAAKFQAVRALSYTSHTTKSLSRKLMQKGVKEDAANAAVEYVCKMGYIDDEDYAVRYARELLHSRKYGPLRVKQMLFSKGITRETAEKAIAENMPDTVDDLVELIRTKYVGADLSDYKQRQKVSSALARRGYTWDDISAALSSAQKSEDW